MSKPALKPLAPAKPKVGGNMSYLGKSIEDTYQNKELRDHILSDPDTYAGSIDPQTDEMWYMDQSTNRMKLGSITFSECFYKLFDEILVNAMDQHHRINTRLINDKTIDLKPVTQIKVNIFPEEGRITVFNDGDGIDVAPHPAHLGKYVPEVIFGVLLTGVNYDNSEERTVGGKNGYGAKITNIFSKEFTIETVDRHRGLLYKQTFRDNMTIVEKPEITKYTKKPYTSVSYLPDYSRFGVTNPVVMQDWHLIRKRTYDASACTERSCSIYLDDVKLNVKEFEDYVNLYIGPKSTTSRVFQRFGDRWQVAVCLSPDGEGHQISFVNGISTDRGGRHVNHILDNLAKKVVDQISTSKGAPDIKPAFVKKNLMVFVRSTIVNPRFDTQTKRKLTSTVDSFGSKCDLDEHEFVPKVLKLGIMKLAKNLADFQAKQVLDRKTDGNARTKKIYHPHLIDAAAAGPGRKKITTIVFTEGTSAAGFVGKGLKGIADDQHKYWGYFPLRGKLLNLRNATAKQLESNEEIKMIKQIIGLKSGVKYTDTRQLRYDRVMIMADADNDGHHIKGLVMNIFSVEWPELLQLPGFICDIALPIKKAERADSRGIVTQNMNFFSEEEYNAWLSKVNPSNREVPRGWDVTYCKGLATYTTSDAIQSFREMRVNNYEWDAEPIKVKIKDDEIELPNCSWHFQLAFEPTSVYSQKRKDWLGNGEEPHPTFANSGQINKVSFSYFVDNFLKLYSMADNVRSIPHLMDGLKPSQRKIIYCALKRNLKRNIKVQQLSGYVSEHGAYHHGAASLDETIVSMAQDYVGHCNVNLLEPSGNFGGRMGGGADMAKGKDHGASRYIFTRLSPVTSHIFNGHDSPLVGNQLEEGKTIEPLYYVSCLPMILINGASGIGTGYSTDISAHNPDDVIANIRRFLDEQPLQPMIPWYRGFKGRIVPTGTNKYITVGCYHRTGPNSVRVSELPVGVNNCCSFKKYAEFLNSLLSDDSAKKHIKTDAKKGKVTVTKSQSPTSSTITNSKAKEAVLESYDIVKATDTELLVDLNFLPGVLDAKLENNTNFSFEKWIGLAYNFTTNNLTLYNTNNEIQIFKSTEEILTEYCKTRLEYYEKRRLHLIGLYSEEAQRASSRYRFILEQVTNVLDIRNKTQAKVVELLENSLPPYPKLGKGKNRIMIDDEDDESIAKDYSYLLDMKIRNLTEEYLDKLKKEKEDCEAKVDKLKSQTDRGLWRDDLSTIQAELVLSHRDWLERNQIKDVPLKPKPLPPLK
jgi:DNA topoisomerase-2